MEQTDDPRTILRAERERANLSQSEMARALRIDKASYWRLEDHQRRFFFVDAQRAAERLGIPIARFAGQKEQHAA